VRAALRLAFLMAVGATLAGCPSQRPTYEVNDNPDIPDLDDDDSAADDDDATDDDDASDDDDATDDDDDSAVEILVPAGCVCTSSLAPDPAPAGLLVLLLAPVALTRRSRSRAT